MIDYADLPQPEEEAVAKNTAQKAHEYVRSMPVTKEGKQEFNAVEVVENILKQPSGGHETSRAAPFDAEGLLILLKNMPVNTEEEPMVQEVRDREELYELLEILQQPRAELMDKLREQGTNSENSLGTNEYFNTLKSQIFEQIAADDGEQTARDVIDINLRYLTQQQLQEAIENANQVRIESSQSTEETEGKPYRIEEAQRARILLLNMLSSPSMPLTATSEMLARSPIYTRYRQEGTNAQTSETTYKLPTPLPNVFLRIGTQNGQMRSQHLEIHLQPAFTAKGQ